MPQPLGFSSPPNRSELGEALDGEGDSFGALVARVLRKVVGEALEAWMTTLTAAGDEAALGSIPAQWSTWVTNEGAVVLTNYWLEGASMAWMRADTKVDLPAGAFPERWANVGNRWAAEYQLTTTNRLVGIGDDLWRDVKARVGTTVQTAGTIPELRSAVRGILDVEVRRADAIARTEVNGAYINGDRLGAEALGPYGPAEHVWVARPRDRRTRDTHVAAHDQVQPFRHPFMVGEASMMHPHASGAPAKEVVNCRCHEEHLWSGDRRPDGTKVP